MLPAEIKGIVGEPLVVTCVLPDHLAAAYDSSELAFEFQKGRLLVDESQLVEEAAITVLRVNSTVAVLNYTALPFDWNDSLVGCYLRNHSSINGNRFMRVYCECFDKVFTMLVDVDVGRKQAHAIASLPDSITQLLCLL